MTRDEHRALAEQQIAEADRMFATYEETEGSYSEKIRERNHKRICHLRQSAAVHAALAGLPDQTEGPIPADAPATEVPGKLPPVVRVNPRPVDPKTAKLTE